MHYDGQDSEALADLPRYQSWILEAFRPHLGGRVVEIGAGIGNVAMRYAPSAEEAVLIEPAPNLHPRLAERFAGHANVRVLGTTLERAIEGGTARRGTFDAVVLINVLEHIADDTGFLRTARSLLKPRGALLVFVPALPWLYGSLDELVGHERRYTAGSLSPVVRRAGFEVSRMQYFDVFGVVPWLLVGRVLRAKTFDERSAKAYDRVVVPLARVIEQAVAPPLGKNLSCVAHAVE